MKRRKINFENIFISFIVVICFAIVVHDVYMITVYSWIKGTVVQFTALGLVTFVVALITCAFFSCYLNDYIKEQEKKTHVTTQQQKSKNL